MKDRIVAILHDKNLSAGKFAEIMDVQPSSISHLVAGRNKPNFDFIEKLLERMPEINPDWFILGKGSMYRSKGLAFGEALPKKDVSLSLFEEENSTEDTPKTLAVPQNEPVFPQKNRKRIEKIVIFYSDQTFSLYTETD